MAQAVAMVNLNGVLAALLGGLEQGGVPARPVRWGAQLLLRMAVVHATAAQSGPGPGALEPEVPGGAGGDPDQTALCGTWQIRALINAVRRTPVCDLQ
ncbi:hypothetical protein [Streptomyces lydicus]|uniref:hypothetical protein n=1 Tax=Streptomyces lydicus TaxID=47763 RepID=UPI0036E57604